MTASSVTALSPQVGVTKGLGFTVDKIMQDLGGAWLFFSPASAPDDAPLTTLGPLSPECAVWVPVCLPLTSQGTETLGCEVNLQ